MKWKWIAPLLVLAVLAGVLAGVTFRSSQAKLLVNDKQIKPAFLLDGHIIVSVRQVAQALGASVQWDENSHVISITAHKPAPATGGSMETSYYPRVPAQITSPQMALQAYFGALSNASNLVAGQGPATGGTAGFGTEPYPTAYGYWSKDWQARHSYAAFLASWQGTASLGLLKLLPAGTDNGQPRFFVEIRTWEVVGAEPHVGTFYYAGFFTVGQTPEGWRITGGRLDPEIFDFGGHQPWRSDPEAVAQVDIANSIKVPLGTPNLANNADGTVKVSFTAADGTVNHWAVLVQTENARWQVIDKQ